MRRFTVLFFMGILVLGIGMVSAQDINVTFQGNSSTVEGFTDSTAVIQIRGGVREAGGPPGHNQDVLKWSDQSPAIDNVGGDYWSGVIVFPDTMVGDTVDWKFGATQFDADGNPSDFWESNDNRVFILPANDTTIALAYVSHGFDPPYTPSDSIDVYFRVNMVNNPDFNPDTDVLSIVGDLKSPTTVGDRMWSPGTYTLTREGGTSDYWSYHYRVDSTSAAYASAGTVDSTYFRYAIGTGWDNNETILGQGMFPDNENRGVVINVDTTIAWVYWNNSAPTKAGDDSVTTKFRTNMVNAINDNGFSLGDTLIVRYGYEQSATFGEDTLVNEIGGNFYSTTVLLKNVGIGVPVVYQYYSVLKGQPIREIFFDSSDPNQATSERRKVEVTVVYPTQLDVQDIEDSQTSMRRMPLFQNTERIGQDVTVTWTVDLRPAYYQVLLEGSTLLDTQGEISIGPLQLDSIFVWGVWMNGPAVGDWSNPAGGDWGVDLRANPEKTMYDDGATGGDATAGDSIYSLQRTYYSHPDSTGNTIGQVYKFGIYGGDNEAGELGFGNNHVANIDDSSPTSTIHTQFGSINTNFYSAWDFDQGGVSAIDDESGIVIRNPNLHANYPNPFNPTTTLTFELPKQMKVKLVIYDVLGREVNTLVNGDQKAGVHSVIWNGTNKRGYQVSSGIYFYRMTTDNYSRTLKMVLMK